MDIDQPLALLGSLSPTQFMRRHWQKKPLVVRQAVAAGVPSIDRQTLFRLATNPEVESRLIEQQTVLTQRSGKATASWQMRTGPFAPRGLPRLSQAAWTLLVQGVNLHHGQVNALMEQFRFIPDARLDDVMTSFATPGGGVGPHFDSYDVFLLQTSGRRRWRIGQQKDLSLQKGVPLKILQNFDPEQEFVLEAGDMLYLPPRYAHEGIAESDGGDCITCSIGFRAPEQEELGAELLQRLADFSAGESEDEDSPPAPEGLPHGGSKAKLRHVYKDPQQVATLNPAQIPAALHAFGQAAVDAALNNPLALACVLGEYLTEPKAGVWFDDTAEPELAIGQGLVLDARTRMMYDAHHIFINGESYRARGADATLMRRLADHRQLSAVGLRRASPAAVGLLEEWLAAGWLKPLAVPSVGSAG